MEVLHWLQKVKKSPLPFGEGRGGGFGKRLVACGPWLVEDS